MYRPIIVRNIPQPEVKAFSISQFRGVDFTRSDYITDMRRSPDAVNTVWGTNPDVFDTRFGIKRVLANKLVNDSLEPLKIWGIHIYEPTNEILFHAGTKMYLINETDEDDIKEGKCTVTQLYTGLTETYSTSFMFDGKLYIIGCGKYLVYDGATVSAVENNAYIPTTVIGRTPSGGGTAFEPVNLLTKWRKNSFRATHSPTLNTDSFNGDANTTVFTLTNTSNFTNDPWTVTVNGNEVIVEENRVTGTITFDTAPPTGTGNIVVKYYTEDLSNLVWDSVYQLDSTYIAPDYITATINGETISENTYITKSDTFIADGINNVFTVSITKNIDPTILPFVYINGVLLSSSLYTFNRTTGTFTLTDIPAENSKVKISYPLLPFVVDRINGTVDFTIAPTGIDGLGGVDNVIITFAKKVDGYADQINKCTIYGIFGGGNDTRVFLSGNPASPNKDWHSGLYDPTYFPDIGYTYIGADSVAIKGYVKQYDTQMVIKESTQMDSSAYLRRFTLDETNNAVFPIEQGAVGIGAISKRSFAYLQGLPMFVSRQGVITVNGTNVDNQRTMRDCSTLINSVLTQENNLDECIGVEFEDKYYLFINGKVFVCDSRMRYTDELGNTQYEWMYWTNINATAAKAHIINKKGYLLIGYNGMIYRFKKADDINPYTDENDEETNIEAYWTTPKLYMGAISVKKRVKELIFLFSKQNRINVKVEAIVDNNRTVSMGNYSQAGIFDFSDIDFTDFTFATSLPTFAYKQRAMIERLDNIQIKISKVLPEDVVSSAFGIEAIQVTYQFMNS